MSIRPSQRATRKEILDDTNLNSKSDRHRHHPLGNVSMYVHIKCPTLSAGSSRESGLDTLDRTPPAKTDWVPCVFWGESKNGFVISDHADSSLPKNGRSEKESFTMTTACPRAPREKKKNSNNKLILTAKTRRKSNIS